MKQATYRVETFIVPCYNNFNTETIRNNRHETEEIEIEEVPCQEVFDNREPDTSEEALQNLKNSLIVQNVVNRAKTESEESNKVMETLHRETQSFRIGSNNEACPSSSHKDISSLEFELEELLINHYPKSQEMTEITRRSCNSLNLVPTLKISSQKLYGVTDIPYPINVSKEIHPAGAESEKLLKRTNSLYSPGLFKEIQTLKAIDEKSEESDDRFTDLCYHGCKHGCSAIIPTPQEVSEEVFKDNWLQKLETIKQKESALRAKELLLQKRERSLFKRERDVRIMERTLKEKVKQAELYLKRAKNLQTLLNTNNTREVILHSKPVNLQNLYSEKIIVNKDTVVDKLSDTEPVKCSLNMQDLKKEQIVCNQTHRAQKSPETVKTHPKESQLEESATSTSVSSFETNSSEGKVSKKAENVRNSMTSRSFHTSTSRFSSNNRERNRRPCKIYYEDLDTTLSADIGDSSFVQTSQKFNPALYRRPFSFARSNSERRPKRTENKDCTKIDFQDSTASKEQLGCPVGIEQDKILRRVTENISASQDKTTKFQNYGLIDANVNAANRVQDIESNTKEDKKYSYLNLETGGKDNAQKGSKGTKERPISWNEGTNQWLRKKREVYNTRRSTLEENKENAEKCNPKANKPEKLAKKKDIRNKLFTVFW